MKPSWTAQSTRSVYVLAQNARNTSCEMCMEPGAP